MYGEPLRLGGHPLRANGRVCRVAPGAPSVPPYVSESCVPGGSSIVVVRWVPGTLSLGFGADDELRLPQRQRAVADLLFERALRGVLGLGGTGPGANVLFGRCLGAMFYLAYLGRLPAQRGGELTAGEFRVQPQLAQP